MFQIKLLMCWLVISAIYLFLNDTECESMRNKIKEKLNIKPVNIDVKKIFKEPFNFKFYDRDTYDLVEGYEEFWN